MLALKYPELAPVLAQRPVGLHPLRDLTTGKLVLVLKVTKECILTAKINNGLKFYVAPIETPSGIAPVLLTTFFDDEDEPLAIATAMFNDELPRDLSEVLGYEEVDIYFVDEQGRDQAAYRATLNDGGSLFETGGQFVLFDQDIELNLLLMKQAQMWLGLRGPDDDNRAITATFIDSLWPADVSILDVDDSRNDYIGAAGFTRSELERSNPGPGQERDIIELMKRAFPGAAIVHGPKRIDTDEEIADILVQCNDRVLIVQAKDSPNTEQSLRRKISRKRSVFRHQVSEGVRQMKQSFAFFARTPSTWMKVPTGGFRIEIGERKIFGIIVVKETFADELALCSRECGTLKTKGINAVILDYQSLDALTHRIRNSGTLLEMFEKLQDDLLAGRYRDMLSFIEDNHGLAATMPPK